MKKIKYGRRLNKGIFRLISLALLLAVVLTGVNAEAALALGGEISPNSIDTLEFVDITPFCEGENPNIIHVSGNVYAIAYSGDHDDGYVKTVEVETDGQITDAEIDSMEFDTDTGKDPNIIHVSGNVFAIAYTGKGSDGFLETVEIATDGQITDVVIEALEFDTSAGIKPNIIHVSGNVYAIAYTGKGNDGFVKTVEIAADGQITDAAIDFLEFDTTTGNEPDILHVSGNIYAISYQGHSNDGFLKTVEIAADGQITDAVVDSLEFVGDTENDPNIIHISGDVFAIAYKSNSDDGYVKTVTIAADGQITDAVIDSLVFAGTKGNEPNIVPVSGNVYAISYSCNTNVGFMETVEIATDGQITDAAIDTLTYEAVKGYEPNMLHISGNVYAITYTGNQDVNRLKTIEIATDGQITDSIIDSLDTHTIEPNIINVSGNFYAIAYTGDGYDGFLTTVEIEIDGRITDAVIDTLEFDATRGKEPNIIHVSGNVFAIAYSGDHDDGYVETVEIATDGQIADAVTDSLEFDTTKGKEPSILLISGNVYAIAYRGEDDDGFLKTVAIATDGQITDAVVDSLEFDTVKGKEPNILHISDGNLYAIAYKGEDNDGFLKTVEIAADGQITDAVVDTLEFDAAKGKEPDIIHVSGDIYTIAYKGAGDDGFVKTVEIAADGQITDAVIDTLEFDTTRGKEPNIIHVSDDDVFAVAYSDDSDDGFLKTMEITTDGQITDAVVDSMEFDTTQGREPNIIHVSGIVYVIAYKGADDDGFLKTIEMATLPSADNLTVTNITNNSVDLSWTTPIGASVDQYFDIRYSTVTITPSNWWNCTRITFEQSPAAGEVQGTKVRNLSNNTTYYFAFRLIDENGDTSLLSNVASGTTLASAADDNTAPSAIDDLAAAAGTPATSQVTLSWTAKGDDGTNGVAYSYTIKRSTSTITADNFDEATTLFNTLRPLPNGYSESFTVTQLTADTTYYFAIKIQDEASNISAISNVASITTADTLPTVTDIAPTSGDNGEARTVTITGTHFINTGTTVVRLISSTNAFSLTGVTFVSETELTATVPQGVPAGTYQARITTDNGTSALSSATYTITAAPTPFPIVANLSPKIASTNTAVSNIKVLGENLTGATAVNFNDTAATSFTVVSDTEITADAPGLAVGEYDVKVTTAHGTNSISLVKYTVSDPVVIDATATRDITTSGVVEIETSTIPVGITFETTDTATHILDCEFGGTAEATDTSAEITVTIPPQTTVTDDDGNPYTGDINPPQVVEPDESVMTDLCGCAVVIDMGNPEETLNLSNNFVTQMVLTAPHRPLVWYFNKTTQTYELAGTYGTVDGVSYLPGGIILNQVGDVYTVGVLMEHMSSYATGVEPTITNSPAVATPGEDITIAGTNFDPVRAEVYFGTVTGSVVSRSTTQIVATVPESFCGAYTLKIENADTHYTTTVINSPFVVDSSSIISQWFALGETAGAGVGEITETISATSMDENITFTIPAGTTALDKDGNPLTMLTSTVDPTPPQPPEGISIIGQVYDLGPRGATFDPMVTFEYAYDPALIPEGVAEEELFLAYYDGAAGEWVELPSTVNLVNHTIRGSIWRLATFAIIAPQASTGAAAFSVSNLSIQPVEVQPKETVTITVSVANTGNTEGSYTLILQIKGVKEAEQSVTVAAGDSQKVSFTVSKEAIGSYSAVVNGLSGSFTVIPPVEPTPVEPTLAESINWLLLGGIIAGYLVVTVWVIAAFRRRKRSRLLIPRY